MKVRLLLHWGLERCRPGFPVKGLNLILSKGVSVNELLEQQGIPLGAIGIIVVNGSMTNKNHMLQDRDDVELYPLLDGG